MRIACKLEYNDIKAVITGDLLFYRLFQSNFRMQFPLTLREAAAVIRQDDLLGSALRMDTEANKRLKSIEEKCRNDLLEICSNIAIERKVTVASVINMQAITTMAEKLPETEAEMMQIPHITKANYEKFGERLLAITQNYAAQKLSEFFSGDLTGSVVFHDAAMPVDAI